MPDNAFIESFNGKFRTECLNAKLVPEPRRSAGKMRGLAKRLQRGESTQRDRQQDADGASSDRGITSAGCMSDEAGIF
jgi:hypothetical protein